MKGLFLILALSFGCAGPKNQATSKPATTPELPKKPDSRARALLTQLLATLSKAKGDVDTAKLFNSAGVLTQRGCGVLGRVKAFPFHDGTRTRGAFMYIVPKEYAGRCGAEETKAPFLCAVTLTQTTTGDEALALSMVAEFDGPVTDQIVTTKNMGKGLHFVVYSYSHEGEEAQLCQGADSRHNPVTTQKIFHLGRTLRALTEVDMASSLKKGTTNMTERAELTWVRIPSLKTAGYTEIAYSGMTRLPSFKDDDPQDEGDSGEVHCSRTVTLSWFDVHKRKMIVVKKAALAPFRKKHRIMVHLPSDAEGHTHDACTAINAGEDPPDENEGEDDERNGRVD